MPGADFSESDFNASQDFYNLGRSKLEQLATLTPTELHQSVLLALMSHETGRSLLSLRYPSAKGCGPKKRQKKLR